MRPSNDELADSRTAKQSPTPRLECCDSSDYVSLDETIPADTDSGGRHYSPSTLTAPSSSIPVLPLINKGTTVAPLPTSFSILQSQWQMATPLNSARPSDPFLGDEPTILFKQPPSSPSINSSDISAEGVSAVRLSGLTCQPHADAKNKSVAGHSPAGTPIWPSSVWTSQTRTSPDPLELPLKESHRLRTDASVTSPRSSTRTANNPHACCWLDCNRVFNTALALRRHMARHRSRLLAAFPCNACGKLFTDSTGLRRHARVHSGERPYLCSVCHKSFADGSNCRRHQRNHVQNETIDNAAEVCRNRHTNS